MFADLAAKTSPLLFTRHIPTLRLCSSSSFREGVLAASPGWLRTSLEEQGMIGVLLTLLGQIDLIPLLGALLCRKCPRCTPSARQRPKNCIAVK